MANATSKAQSTTTPFEGPPKIKRDLSVASAATYYSGTMIGINASGHAVKCDDTAGVRFDGIAANGQPITVATTDTLGDHKIDVLKPQFFSMKIASAAITDVGRAVYAKYDNEVAFSGVTNAVLVGHVEAYIDSTSVLVRPYYAPNRGTVTQETNRSTGVTVNALAGTITTDTTSLAAGAEAEFTVTNSRVQVGDVVVVSLASGNTGVGTCVPVVTAIADGSFKILITNLHASTAEVGACVINFVVLKAAHN